MILAELNWNFEWKKLNEEQREVFLKNWPYASKIYNPEKPDEFSHYTCNKQRIGMEEAYALQSAGVPFEFNGIDGMMLTKMVDRGDQSGTVMDIMDAKTVNIAVPDMGLLVMNEVDWLEDACTQELQRRLDEGWRILAVCPPNAQRRPDYILGRYKPKEQS